MLSHFLIEHLNLRMDTSYEEIGLYGRRWYSWEGFLFEVLMFKEKYCKSPHFDLAWPESMIGEEPAVS